MHLTDGYEPVNPWNVMLGLKESVLILLLFVDL